MRPNFKRVVMLVGALVLLAAGVASASPPDARGNLEATQPSWYHVERASTLLAEIQQQVVGLRNHAEMLAAFAGSTRYSRQTHAYYLNGVKAHINSVGERLAELEQIRESVLPWQQRAISQVTPHAAEVASNTQAAIMFLRGASESHLFVPEYVDYVNTIADRSEDLKETVDKYLDYEKTQRKFQRLQSELEVADI